MHINFKYFIVSIGSIFLALGIGILIGSNIASNDTIQKQNTAIINDIDKQFNVLKKKDESIMKENNSLKTSIANVETLFKNNQSLYDSIKLNSQKVGFISFKDKDSLSETEKFISTHGGTTAFNIYIDKGLASQKNIEKINNEFDKKFKKEDEIIDFIMESINSSDHKNLDKLQKSGLISVNSIAYSLSDTDSVVVYLNPNENPKSIAQNTEIPFLRQLKIKKHTVVVQNNAFNEEMLSKISEMKIPTIDNIDSKIASLTLATLINQPNTVGNYGIVKDETLLIPKTN